MERTPIMSADSRTISRRRLETADAHATNLERAPIIPENSVGPQEPAAGVMPDG